MNAFMSALRVHDDGMLARCYTYDAPGDLGDVWDAEPDAIAHILEGPRRLDVPQGTPSLDD